MAKVVHFKQMYCLKCGAITEKEVFLEDGRIGNACSGCDMIWYKQAESLV